MKNYLTNVFLRLLALESMMQAFCISVAGRFMWGVQKRRGLSRTIVFPEGQIVINEGSLVLERRLLLMKSVHAWLFGFILNIVIGNIAVCGGGGSGIKNFSVTSYSSSSFTKCPKQQAEMLNGIQFTLSFETSKQWNNKNSIDSKLCNDAQVSLWKQWKSSINYNMVMYPHLFWTVVNSGNTPERSNCNLLHIMKMPVSDMRKWTFSTFSDCGLHDQQLS